MREAIKTPNPERDRDMIISIGISSITIKGLSETPRNGASTSITMPCITATVALPAALPSTMPLRPSGATRISFKNPNSRSQTIDKPDITELMSTVMAIMPGYINWM